MIPSTSVLLPWLLLLFLPVLKLILKLSKSRSKLNLPPGRRPLPIIGNLHQVIGSDIAHRSFCNLSKIYGPIVHLKLGQIQTVVVSSPSLAEQILKTYDTTFCSRPALAAIHEFTFNGSDIGSAPYGDQWRNLRKIFALHLFSNTKVMSYISVLEKETQRLIKSIKARADSNAPINISENALHLTHSIVYRVAFGDSGAGEHGESLRLRELLEEAHSLMVSFVVGDCFPGMGWIDRVTGKMRKMKRIAIKLDAIYQKVIDKHLNDKKKQKKSSEEDIVDVLLRLEGEGEQLTVDNIKGSLMNIFFGAIGSTSGTITWAMTELVRNPTILKKAQDEIRKVVGKKGRVTEMDLPRLRYLKCVVKESLRLHPVGALLVPRETTQHCQINGYDICPKTRVFVNVWAIGRDENIWKFSEDFNPERFAESSIEYTGQHFQFLPFGGGRRICPGIHFAIATVELALANLLYTFNWELPPGMKKEDIDMSEAPGIAVEKKFPLCLVATNN